MLSLRILIYGVLIALVSACKPPSSDSYFPLDSGLHWTYKRSLSVVEDEWPTTDVFAIQNIGVDDVSNKGQELSVTVRRTSDGTDYYIRQSESGVVRVAKRTVVELNPRFDDSPRMILPSKENLDLGHVWTVESGPYVLHTRPGYSADMTDNRFSMTFEVTQLDALVDVPAGQFDNCIKFEGYASIRLFVDARSGFVDVPITQTEWYAPGVGLVKLVRNEPINGAFYVGGSIAFELQDFES